MLYMVQNYKNMKKFITPIILIAFLAIITSCNSSTNKSEKQQKTGLVVGNIEKSNDVKLTIPLDAVSKLMNKDNRLLMSSIDYTYTRAWVEVLEVEKNKYSYYLGVEASLKSKDNQKTYSCYSIYTELVVVNAELHYLPSSVQLSCTGKCCSNCKLVVYKGGVDCQCNGTSDIENCAGNEKCKLHKSEVLDEKQKKSDII